MRMALCTLVFAVTSVVGLATAVAREGWVDRPDTMHQWWLHDVDQFEDRVRILYSTTPSLQQGQADPEGWRTNVYLVTARADGSVDQQRLASLHEHLVTLVLRRNHRQVMVVRRPRERGGGQRLELWSAEDGNRLSAAEAPALLAGGRTPLDLTGVAPTSDGNLVVVNQQDSGTALVWHKLSPTAELLARGEYRRDDAQIRPAGWFPAVGGGVGLTLRLVNTRGEQGMDSDIDLPLALEVGDRKLEARIASETRLLAADADGELRWISPALERQLMWGGEMQVPPTLPNDERMRQVREQMRQMQETELEHGARRTLRELQRSGRNSAGVKRVPGGYGVLARVVADREREPPRHGTHYLEVDPDGELAREIYLEPAAEALDAKFVDFQVAADGAIVLVGTRRPEGERTTRLHVTRIGADGEVRRTALLEMPTGEIDGLVGDGDNLWAFGHAWPRPDGTKTLLWMAHASQALDAASAAGEPSADATTATPASAPAPARQDRTAPQDREAAEGCTCSCEEFREIQALATELEGMPDPATMQKLQCTQQCMGAYQQCMMR